MFKPEHQPKDFDELMEMIHECRSLSVIALMVEEYLPLWEDNSDPRNNARRILLRAIGALNDLDMIRVLTGKTLGRDQEVRELEAWIATKAQRASRLPE